MRPGCLLNVGVVPHYSVPLFQLLKQILGDELLITSGEEGFGPGLATVPEAWKLVQRLHNHYLLRKRLLWQRGLLKVADGVPLVISDFALRSVSTWVLLMRRTRDHKPTVMWGHASGKRTYMWPLKRWMFNHCAGFIAYTKTQAATIQSQFPAIKVWTAPNALYLKADCYGHLLPAESIEDIIYVGRLVKEKKPMILARAFAQGVKAGILHRKSKLIMVGDGPEYRNIAEFTKGCGLAEQVQLKGHVSNVDMLRDLYATALVSVSPGCLGLSAIQSFGFSVPMVISRDEPHGPESEACIEGFNSWRFRTDSAESLLRALSDCFARKSDILAKRRQICIAIQENYSLEAMAKTFLEVMTCFNREGRSK